tara:strand:+ start:2022 stop:2357 length:336 start_codon:yes stop_codon:yes gene_type:complete
MTSIYTKSSSSRSRSPGNSDRIDRVAVVQRDGALSGGVAARAVVAHSLPGQVLVLTRGAVDARSLPGRVLVLSGWAISARAVRVAGGGLVGAGRAQVAAATGEVLPRGACR